MQKINILPEETINKIAAGEVIERPASIVKELIENSIDAAATNIEIRINESVLKYILVADNGEGMNEKDIKICYLRHATSKIKNSNDLFALNSLGFRGEALPSIAAISKLSIVTKQKENLQGIKLEIENGNLKNQSFTGTQNGTTIIVENIFNNVPARKKFLKSDAYEKSKITELIHYFALGYENISFKLFFNDREAFFLPSRLSLLEKTVKVLGNTKEDYFVVDFQFNLNSIIGKCQAIISLPKLSFPHRRKQIIFVNNRLVKYFPLAKAIEEVLFLAKDKFPSMVILLNLPPEIIDANCHPQKNEVKISSAKEILNIIKDNISEELKKNILSDFKNLNYEDTAKDNFKGKVCEPNFNLSQFKEEIVKSSTEQLTISAIKQQTINFNFIGQTFLTYLIAEKNNNLIFVDQHALHERILYQKFKKKELNIYQQILLIPYLIKLSPEELSLALENKVLLEEFGFNFEEFGNNEIALKSVPSILNKNLNENTFIESLNLLYEERQNINIAEKILQMFSCRRAMKAGDKITKEEAEYLLFYFEDLEKLQPENLFCAHNRPTVFIISKYDIEKKFHRK